MVGHGAPGSSGHHSAAAIAAKLTGASGMPDGNHDITFTSCYAGSTSSALPRVPPADKSVISTVSSAIKTKWPDASFKVKGADGPSIKTMSAENEELWAVVNDEHIAIAGTIQMVLNACYGVNIKAEIQKADTETDLEAAERVATTYKNYFKDFIYIVNKEFSKTSKKFQDFLYKNRERIPEELITHFQIQELDITNSVKEEQV